MADASPPTTDAGGADTPHAGASVDAAMRGLEAAGEIAEVLRTHVADLRLPSRRLLVLAFGDVALTGLAAVAQESAVFRLSDDDHPTARGESSTSRDLPLPFSGQAFDVVVAYRIAGHADIRPYLRDMRRVMRPDGIAVLIAHRQEFAFAPLPEVGRAHLLRRWMRDAGFDFVEVPVQSDASRAIALARIRPTV